MMVGPGVMVEVVFELVAEVRLAVVGPGCDELQ